MNAVDQSAALFRAMSLQDLSAYVSCPLMLQANFERVMREKYGITEIKGEA